MITRLFYFLFFVVPLVLFHRSSETFEFNKMVAVYMFTALIMLAWTVKCVIAKKIIFRKSLLDVPLLVFLGALVISTFFSIDVRTSILGHYSRFHGGLLSYFCYSLLYWAFVSNFPQEKIKKLLFVIIGVTVIVSSFGALEHFGYFPVCAPVNLYEITTQTDQSQVVNFKSLFQKKCWQQDVQNRVFSTFGQPNWLAAWLVAVLPIIWVLSISNLFKRSKLIPYILSALFFATLLFTKSRSGLLGLVFADAIFWGIYLIYLKKKVLLSFAIHNLIFVVLFLVVGSPLSSSLNQAPEATPALESGGTESGEIRKIVWRGALDLWQKYPILGTGPETFAYSYFETRPVEHNLVSEWNFIYNRAHNEYLNFLATTGSIGFLSYVSLIVFAFFVFFNSQFTIYNLQKGLSLKIENWPLKIAMLAGFASILVTNFFGFSVVPLALLFFLYPAMATVVTVQSSKYKVRRMDLDSKQRLLVLFVLCTTFYVLFVIGKYWYTDFLYAKGRLLNKFQRFSEGRRYLVEAVNLSGNEPTYWAEVSNSSTEISLSLAEAGDEEGAAEVANTALYEAEQALSLSPRNVNAQRAKISALIKLGTTDPNYLPELQDTTKNAIVYAPTDASLYYSLALTTSRLGQNSEALSILDKTIELKPNYKNARFAKALILTQLGRLDEARVELVYILEKIDPNDELAKKELSKLN